MTASQLLPELICLRRLGLLADLWAALRRLRLIGMLLSLLIASGFCVSSLSAQDSLATQRTPLLDHRVPTGVWGEWIRAAGRTQGIEFQNVRVDVPTSCNVTWFCGSREVATEAEHVRLSVGQSYRLRLSELPEFPGVELFPSVEVLDRLHAPSGHAESFPIPLTFTIEELDAAIAGQMLTKVVYLEQPQFASPFELTSDIATRTVNSRANLIEEADKAGRPLAIIRLGGRLPAANESRGPFFGGGAPVLPIEADAKGTNPVKFTPAEPRVQLASHADAQESESTPNSKPITANPKLAEQFPDEYIFDGGDRGFPVHYDRESMLGIESEDTIAEYHDHNGNRRVKATNRVAIYAPRFAAVRSVSGIREDFNVLRPISHLDQVQGAAFKQRVGGKTNSQRDRLHGVRMRTRVGGVLGKATDSGVNATTTLLNNTKWLNLFQETQFLHDGQIRQKELASLRAGMNAAINWSRVLNPVIVASLTPSQETYANFKVAELVGLDESHKKPGQMRIVKLADKETAKPGDVITFTIRFDNLGDRDLQNVRIIDNLTPRLEFVADSAESDFEGSINVDDNGEGSQILRFELAARLAGHSGGVITFQAKLR